MKSVFTKKTKINIVTRGKLFWLLFPLLPILISFFIIYRTPLTFIQSGADTIQSIKLEGYDDRSVKGNSSHEILKNNSGHLSFKYTRREGYFSPFSGVVYVAGENSFFNLSPYDYVKIKIKAKHGTRIPIVLSAYIPDFSRPEDVLTFRSLQSVLNVKNQFNEIEISFKDFKTPDWWYGVHNKKEEDFSAPDFSKVKFIHFTNCINIKKNLEDVVDIEEISFHVNLLPFYFYSGISIIGYYLILLLILIRNKNKVIKDINFQYDKNEASISEAKEEDAVFGYLTTHYTNEGLLITDVHKATGIQERDVSGIIKEKTGLSFKQFLNQIRLFEAKRLLTETDLQIAEIASKVGYGNISHFNRIFKTYENCSPNIYRKEKSNILNR